MKKMIMSITLITFTHVAYAMYVALPDAKTLETWLDGVDVTQQKSPDPLTLAQLKQILTERALIKSLAGDVITTREVQHRVSTCLNYYKIEGTTLLWHKDDKSNIMDARAIENADLWLTLQELKYPIIDAILENYKDACESLSVRIEHR